MKANVHYDESGEASSFVVKGKRTRWHWSMDNDVATFRRVEIEKDDHSTETHVVMFGEEWKSMMAFVETLPFVRETQIQDAIE